MDDRRFDGMVRAFGVPTGRRTLGKTIAAGALGAALSQFVPKAADAGGAKKLRQRCRPGKDTCKGSLKCGAPTTRHQCSSTVQGIRNWCCVERGAACRDTCDCCGDFYCSFNGDNPRVGRCVRNPER